MELTKTKQSNIKTRMNNKVTSDSEGQKKPEHKPQVNLGPHLSELIYNLT